MRNTKQLIQQINEEIFKNLDLIIEFAAAKLYFIWHVLQLDDSSERISLSPFTMMIPSLPIDLGQVLKGAFFEIQKETISKYFSEKKVGDSFDGRKISPKEEREILHILGKDSIANHDSGDILEEMASYFVPYPTLEVFLKKGEAVGKKMLYSFARMRQEKVLDLDIVDPTFSYFLNLYEKNVVLEER